VISACNTALQNGCHSYAPKKRLFFEAEEVVVVFVVVITAANA
jgi:hypothetical protein